MEEIETTTESDASEGESSGASVETGGEAPAKVEAAPEQKQDTTPFHEHPRFKELVEQKNESARRYQDMESRYQTLQQQLSSLKESQQPKAPSEFDQLIKDLKGVDPRLAAALESQAKAAESAKSLEARLEAFEKQSQEAARTQTLSTAVAKINSLHDSNKMSDFGKQFINNQMDIAYRNGQLNASDLKAVESMYGEASKAIKAYEESLKRATTESYVQDKKKDASVPTSQPKGAPAKPAAKKNPFSSDKETAKQQIVSRYLKQAAANREADPV